MAAQVDDSFPTFSRAFDYKGVEETLIVFESPLLAPPRIETRAFPSPNFSIIKFIRSPKRHYPEIPISIKHWLCYLSDFFMHRCLVLVYWNMAMKKRKPFSFVANVRVWSREKTEEGTVMKNEIRYIFVSVSRVVKPELAPRVASLEM